MPWTVPLGDCSSLCTAVHSSELAIFAPVIGSAVIGSGVIDGLAESVLAFAGLEAAVEADAGW